MKNSLFNYSMIQDYMAEAQETVNLQQGGGSMCVRDV